MDGDLAIVDPDMPLHRFDENGNRIDVLFCRFDGKILINPIRLAQIKAAVGATTGVDSEALCGR